jgi:molecular chaperone Hsp33
MNIGNALAWDDTVLPFQLDRPDIRGRIARLDGVLDTILHQHAYPPAVEALVSEAAILTALIGQTMKLRWRFSLQVRGTGAVKMVATDYYCPQEAGEPARIRAWASFDAEIPTGTKPYDLLGDGYFAVVIDQGQDMQPYQGITPLTGGSLAACAETYFAQSEQLPTRFSIQHGRSQVPGGPAHWRAGGIMIQHMPATGGIRAEEGSGEGGLLTHADILAGDESEDWVRTNVLLDTVEEIELIGPSVAPTDLLVRLFHEEGPRVYDAQTVRFGCSCSAEKVRHSLSIYSPREIGQMLTPDGILTADCQFCGAHYAFDPATLGSQAAHG